MDDELTQAETGIFNYISAIPDIPRNDRGKEYKSKCPCGGTLTSIRSRYNGHLHAKCDKCRFCLME